MSEYMRIEEEETEDPFTMISRTNLQLAEGDQAEVYESSDALYEGGTVAQLFAPVEGILRLELDGTDAIITRDPQYDWYNMFADISGLLKDFFI